LESIGIYFNPWVANGMFTLQRVLPTVTIL